MKKIMEIFVFPILLMIGLTFVMGFYQERNIYFKLNDITLELGDKLPEEISHYMGILPDNGDLALESDILLDEDGNVSTIGKFNYYLVYKDSNYKFSKLTNVKSTITVVDTVSPILSPKDDVKIKYDSKFSLDNIVDCFDLSGCSLSSSDEVDTKKSGDYEISVKAIDGGGNISYTKAKFTVLEKPKPKPVYNYDLAKVYGGSVQEMNNRNNERNSSLSAEDKSNLRYQIANFAKQFIGNPYVAGGTSLTNGTDCSGFTMSLYANYGYGLPRTAGAQGAMGIAVGAGDLQPGDLIVYTYGHSGIYVGGGMMVHAATSQSGIVMQPMFDGYRVYRRIIY